MTDTKKFPSIVMTGVRPTGRLHLGHYVGFMQNNIKLQDQYDTCFCMVADIQALTDNFDNPQKVHDHVMEVILDSLAVGIDPKKTHFFIQSQIPEIAELTVLFMNLVTVNQLLHNPTIKTEIKQKGFEESIPLGFLAYPVSQAADILFCKGNIVPVGEDQMPVLEQANDIVKKFNALYGGNVNTNTSDGNSDSDSDGGGDIFPIIKGITGSTARLVGIDGNAKASKSLGNAIMLSDSPEEIERKVMAMYTDPKRLKKTDPGNVEGNVVFQYLDIFASAEARPQIEEYKNKYREGGDSAPGDVEIKKFLIQELRAFLDPIRARREEYVRDMNAVRQIVQDGIAVAREHAAKTMQEVREVMKINYFS